MAVNDQLGDISYLGFQAALAGYIAALVCFGIEFASSRGAAPTPAEAVSMKLRAASKGRTAVLDRPGEIDTGGTSGIGRIVKPPKPPRPSMGALFGRAGLIVVTIGFAAQLFSIVTRGIAAGRAPWGNMYEFTISAMMCIVGAYLFLLAKWGMRWLGLPVTLLAAVGNGLAVTVFYVAVSPLVPALHSVWFLIHIVCAAISAAAFNIAGVASILYLIRKRAEARGTVRGYLAKVPDSRRVDAIAYRFNAFAFPLWTFTVAAGSIWAEYAWGRYWGWDPKETWALVTWVIYACYLHARSTAGWRGTRAAVISIIGVVSFWFNFIGINLLVSGLHSYAGI
jgi:cytochrome c-type biogenesis protein CcsB